VDKPAGISSHDVVVAARRAFAQPRVGHAGTLDPFATGLLVLLAGRATRLARFLPDEPKVYEALVRFGAETGTEDPQGVVLREAPLPARAALEAAARALVGTIDQVPPTFSAKHVEGARAYELARAGIPVALPAVRVTVHALTLDACEGADDAVARCRLSVTCGGGTYVRSLARDLGRAAGSAAHLEALRRLAAGAAPRTAWVRGMRRRSRAWSKFGFRTTVPECPRTCWRGCSIRSTPRGPRGPDWV